MSDKITVTLYQIEMRSKQALTAHGASSTVAASVASAIREAEARGNLICGLYYLDSYCTHLRTGRVLGDATPKVSRPKPGTVQVNAGFGFAQPAFDAGLAEAVEATRTQGVAALSIHHSHTCTSMGYFTEILARNGLIAIGMTNAPACVAPPGGSVPVLGTNPISMAVPDGSGGIAMLFDQSTSATAIGKVRVAAAKGETVPDGWIVDADGAPTTDPTQMASLVSSGGYKGYGFGLMAEILAAALTGSVLSKDAAPLKAPDGPHHDLGQLYLLIDPGSYDQGFIRQINALASAIEAQDGARMPGRGKILPEEVCIDAELWRSVETLAQV